MKAFLASLIFAVLSLNLAQAEKELRITVSVNIQRNLKMVASDRTPNGDTYTDAKLESVKEGKDIDTHTFLIKLPKKLSDEEVGRLTITIMCATIDQNPIGYGLVLCSLQLKDIPKNHIQIDLIRAELDVTDHYKPGEEVHSSTKASNGFENGTIHQAYKADDGRTKIRLLSAQGESEIITWSMKARKEGEEMEFKTWTGAITKDKPAVWKLKKK